MSSLHEKICNNCMEPNHFAVCCMDKRAAVDDLVNGTESDGNFVYLEMRTTEMKRGRKSHDWIVTMSLEGNAAEGRCRSAG